MLEGLFKCGKTTQLKLLEKNLKESCPENEIVVTKEPGGSEIADHIRSVVQGFVGLSFSEPMTPECNVALYMASRGQTLPTVVRPALDKGGIVLSDRSLLSSGAFQGAGQEFGVEKVLELNRLLIGDMTPGLALFIDVKPQTAYSRTLDTAGDKWESMLVDFFERARNGYLWMMENKPDLNLVRVDGEGTIEEVQSRINEQVIQKMRLWGVAMLGV